MFETKWNRSETPNTETGERYAPVYKLTATGDLEQDGEIDTYAEIQSHADSTDIYTIMARYENGETEILNRKNGQWIDLTEMPTTFAEMHQLIIEADQTFQNLPLDIREKYNFSTADYIADIGSPRWIELMKGEKADDVIKIENPEGVKIDE